MEPPRFTRQYWPILKGLRLIGLPSPWMKPSSRLVRFLYYLNDVHLGGNSVYFLLTYSYTIFVANLRFQDICSLGVGMCTFISALFLIVYLHRNSHLLKKIADEIDRISDTVMGSGLGREELFPQIYKRKAWGLPTLALVMMFLPFFSMATYAFPVPISDWLEGAYRSRHPIATANPFDDKQPGVYELIFYLQATLVSSSSKKSATDCTFIAMIKGHSAVLCYLSEAMVHLKSQLPRNDCESRKKLKAWVKIHRDVIKNSHELLLIFSPVLIINYFNVVGIVVCGLFVQLKKDSDNFVQSLGMGVYVGIALVQLYAVTTAAEEISAEVQKASFSAYDTPWYELKKPDATTILMVMTISSRPIQLTAYYTNVFLINKETFAGLIVSSISAFVTLCQMKDLFE